MAINIYRGTTPPFTLRFPVDLTDWDVYITFEQKRKPENLEITIHDGIQEIVRTEKGSNVILVLSQEDTLKFNEGSVAVQMRAYKGGTAIASKQKTFSVKDILLEGVIPLD